MKKEFDLNHYLRAPEWHPLDNVPGDRDDSCPIHRFIDVERFITLEKVPDYLHQPFHELVRVRGKYPWDIKEADQSAFRDKAEVIVKEWHLSPEDSDLMAETLMVVISKWDQYRIRMN